MKQKKLVYIVSEVNKSLHFEWIASSPKENYRLSFILIGAPNSELEKFLKNQNIVTYSVAYKNKIDSIKAWIKVFGILFLNRPDIIHTHLWIANLIGLTTGYILRIKKRIYTRHHATIHYDLYPSGIKWDKLNNFLATDIIAISKNIELILTQWDKAKKDKVVLIHHGFDLSYFQNVNFDRIQIIREKYQLSKDRHPVIGVISRFTKWKGIQFIIPAFKKILSAFPESKLILANAHGDYEEEINELLKTLPSSSHVKIKFENDLAALYHVFDIFIHVPIDSHAEAFGQIYVESLAVGIPSVFTLSGIALEFIRHEENALVVDFENETQIYDSIYRLIIDQCLRKKIIANGLNSVSQFSFEKYTDNLNKLYLRV